ncbi:MAG TPA: PaaI family thioesterase [Rhizomicrobium sp.]
MEAKFGSLAELQATLDATPLHRWLGFRVESFDAALGLLVIAAPCGINAARFDGAGQAHGGAIATLIDSCATFACSSVLGRPVPTMNMLVDYLRPAAGDVMTATARVRRTGKTASLIDVDVLSGGKLVATGRCVLASGG